MARPYKARRICSIPSVETLVPVRTGVCQPQVKGEAAELTLEEYESIRLIDWLDCTQEECASRMGVARTTVQAVYNSARKKLADCLVNGRPMEIRGGNYSLCPEGGDCCKKDCRKHGCRKGCCDEKTGGDYDEEDCCNL